MKTKTTIIATVVTLAVIGGAALQMSKHDDSTTTTAMPALGSPKTPQSRKVRESSAKDSLAELSQKKIPISFRQITLLADSERLIRLRKDLGMNISDEAYRKAIAAYGYQINSEALREGLLKQWNSEDPRAATLWLIEQYNAGYGINIPLTGSLAAWLVKDKAAAMAWAEENAGADDLIDALKLAESLKLNPTPSSSAEFTSRLGDMRKSLEAISDSDETALNGRKKLIRQMRSLVNDWSEQYPADAVKFFAENQEKLKFLDETPEMSSSTKNFFDLGSMIERWAHLDPDAALQWVKATDDEKLLTKSLLRILPSWNLKYPDKSISDATDLSVLPDDDYNSLISTVARNLAITNPSAAMEFAMSEKEPKLQKEMVERVMDTWTLKSPIEARQWIEDAPAGELRDSAIIGYVETRLANFEDNGKLMREIGNPDLREKTIREFILYTDAIEEDLPKTLELARELPKLYDTHLGFLAEKIDPRDLPAFRTWLEQVEAEGRIVFSMAKESFDEYEPAVADQKRREYYAARHEELFRRLEEKVNGTADDSNIEVPGYLR